MRLFVLASRNAHKKEEYERLIQNAKVEVFESFKAEENGINYTENARIKLLALKKLIDEKNIKLEGGVLRGEGCRFNFYKSQKHVRFFFGTRLSTKQNLR